MFPLFLQEPSGDSSEGSSAGRLLPLHEFLIQTLEAAGPTSAESEVLRQNFWRLARRAQEILEERLGMAPFWEVYHEARETFLEAFDTSAAGLKVLENLMAQLEEHLPDAGCLLALGDLTHLHLYRAALSWKRRPLFRSFLKEAGSLASSLRDQLRLHQIHSQEGNSSAALRLTLGGAAGFLIDDTALAGVLPHYRGSKPMEPERRQRLEQHLETLERFVNAESHAELTLVHDQALPAEVISAGATALQDDDTLSRARRVFEESARSMVGVFGAMRAARLEMAGTYDPGLHDEVFANLTWQSLTVDELKRLPPVVALISTQALGQDLLGTYSRLLHSGSPIHVLLTQDPARSLVEQLEHPSEGFHPGWGYLSVAHREALVHHSTLAEPLHLMDGLLRMASSTRPAVAFVEVPELTAAPPEPGRRIELAWSRSRAALESRATPCYTYDPDGGETWADRFDLGHNPQPDKPWAEHAAEAVVGKAALCFTIAHWAALDPACRCHLKLIPEEAWSSDQVELSDYLQQGEAAAPQGIPFIWVLDEEGTLQRAVVTRELTLCCWDGQRHWRILQELAGINNQYVLRAEESTRAKAREEFEVVRQELEAKHREELQRIEERVAAETIDRLVAVLSGGSIPVAAAMPGPESAPATEPPAQASAEESQAGAAPEASPSPVDAEAPEEAGFDEPYIEAALCTSCNDCINVNPLLFKYNPNKQAYIDDPKAGTFAQLVKAAEKCPARCIHPGKPRPDDETVTEALLAKAGEFA